MALKRAGRERIKGITTPASLSDLDAQMEVKKAKERFDAVPGGQGPQTQSREKGGGSVRRAKWRRRSIQSRLRSEAWSDSGAPLFA